MRKSDGNKFLTSSKWDTDSPFRDAVVVPIEDSMDLHSFAPKDISSVVEEYIEQCVRAGIYEIRLIHGRGKGIQRRRIRSLLRSHPLVVLYKDAPPETGGWGVTVVLLKHDLSEPSSD